MKVKGLELNFSQRGARYSICAAVKIAAKTRTLGFDDCHFHYQISLGQVVKIIYADWCRPQPTKNDVQFLTEHVYLPSHYQGSVCRPPGNFRLNGAK